MIRNFASGHLDHDPEFNWRGTSVTRIENLSDIVFALALGMIVSAAAPPTTLQQLTHHLISLIAVALACLPMFAIWNAHFIFFRRYNLADGHIILLNACLLLLVLFIAYPLRFLFDSLFAYILGVQGDWSRMQSLGINSTEDAAVITAYFGAGFSAIQAILNRMHAHAFRHRDNLNLSATEIALTRRNVWQTGAGMMISLSIVAIALWTPVGPFAGCLLVGNWIAGVLTKKAIRLHTE